MQYLILEKTATAPRVALVLPAAFLLHLAEEWYGGFLDWTPIVLGYEMSVERFIIINASALLVFTVGALASVRYARVGWFAASLAVLLGLNGVLHVLGTIGFGIYSPGALTGLVLYVPLSIIVLRWASAALPGTTFGFAVVFGIVLHALVPILAFI